MRYRSALEKEMTAFENLIATKQHMVISLPDSKSARDAARLEDAQLLGDTRDRDREYFGSGDSRSSSVSRASARRFSATGRDQPSLIVDVREFRSTLPSLLHSVGFAILPRTINVGDYILSEEICVERKGISDLHQSFASGRLFNQAESMTKHYKFPCLLIEFSPEKSFALQVRWAFGYTRPLVFSMDRVLYHCPPGALLDV